MATPRRSEMIQLFRCFPPCQHTYGNYGAPTVPPSVVPPLIRNQTMPCRGSSSSSSNSSSSSSSSSSS
eukprot:5454813-Heterocapsa_arctica.AAC.1